jgi:hypothetical protein
MRGPPAALQYRFPGASPARVVLRGVDRVVVDLFEPARRRNRTFRETA